MASEPCCICKGQSVAHHLTIAHVVDDSNKKARGLKVGDNWTVPLCGNHHEELHRFGDERLYWLLYGIDPFSIAKELWKRSQE